MHWELGVAPAFGNVCVRLQLHYASCSTPQMMPTRSAVEVLRIGRIHIFRPGRISANARVYSPADVCCGKRATGANARRCPNQQRRLGTVATGR